MTTPHYLLWGPHSDFSKCGSYFCRILYNFDFESAKTLQSAHRMYRHVPYGSYNKQRLFPQTALTGWAL
jgi:hypothetical protein